VLKVSDTIAVASCLRLSSLAGAAAIAIAGTVLPGCRRLH
jgi:hypothetical protein